MPYMDEASLCDRIAFLDNGKILTIDTPAELINKFKNKIFAVKTNHQFKAIKDLKKYKFTINVNAFGEFAHLTSNSELNTIEEIILIKKYLLELNHSGIEVFQAAPTIEDCFMELAKNA